MNNNSTGGDPDAVDTTTSDYAEVYAGARRLYNSKADNSTIEDYIMDMVKKGKIDRNQAAVILSSFDGEVEIPNNLKK